MSTFVPIDEPVSPEDVYRAYLELKTRRLATRKLEAEERPPVEFPEVVTLKERLALPPDPVAWRVEGWLPAGGRAVLAAPAKAGKTHVALNLVRCLVDGHPWLSRDQVVQVTGTVVVFDFEMTDRQLYDWYRDVDIAAADRVVVVPLRGRGAAFDLRDEDLRERWARMLRDVGAEFVVWDCLRPVVDALGLDENHDASALLTHFDALLVSAGQPEALVVHHMGHSGERARGDSGIIGWGDANWKLLLDDGNEHGARYLTANGRDVAQPETQVSTDPGSRRLVVSGGSRASARMSAASNTVLSILQAASEPLNASTIEAEAMAAGTSRAAAREALGQLIALHQVSVEIGERNARLHRLNEASSPVRHSSPEPASEVPRQFAAGLIGRRGGEQTADQEKADQFAGLTPEQAAILSRLPSPSPTDHEESDHAQA